MRDCCVYCGTTFVMSNRGAWTRRRVHDHVEPLSRGGQDVASNIVQCCHGCNASKGDMFLLEWMIFGRGIGATRPLTDKLCAALDVTPGELFERTKKGKR